MAWTHGAAIGERTLLRCPGTAERVPLLISAALLAEACGSRRAAAAATSELASVRNDALAAEALSRLSEAQVCWRQDQVRRLELVLADALAAAHMLKQRLERRSERRLVAGVDRRDHSVVELRELPVGVREAELVLS